MDRNERGCQLRAALVHLAAKFLDELALLLNPHGPSAADPRCGPLPEFYKLGASPHRFQLTPDEVVSVRAEGHMTAIAFTWHCSPGSARPIV